MDIDFTFNIPISVTEVLRAALRSGGELSRNGEISYLIDEDGTFNWHQETGSSIERVITEIGKDHWTQHTVGISLIIPGSDRGGDLIFHPGRSTISFIVAINRKTLPGSSKFCDIGWYLSSLVPILEPFGLSEIETVDSA
ncbi:hypothetical protein OG204_12285 [Streptomyces sp. NBC_01387]|uniref:hypothetical protein n=1 Tax=unclassified Streptomyces TaxID=2593676 RepID=UPI0020245545|nr:MULTISPECIES: hypothetical protein [unclassified Streptomyces]MCX4550982.1 hypothetical protein [Streptomyces sp. NBC_01500]WSC22399.1 hypothetical protein OIE60_23465 [Streptomyces sp. NBC_01766]WSV56242.1 hypothetical protein OG282_22535 [Streptomyces sp. NBC_01014]